MQISQAQNTTTGTELMASCNSTGDHCKTWGDSSTSVELLVNQDNQGIEYDYRGNPAVGTVGAVLFGIIVIVGLVGNAVVVLVGICKGQMRSTTYILIMNLAVADLLFLFSVPFKAWDYTLGYWPFGDAWCRIVKYVFLVCAFASIYTLVLMSVDRFLAVVYPVWSISIRTPTNAFRCILLTWITILVACVPLLDSYGVVIVNDLHSFCGFRVGAGYDKAAFYVSVFVICFVVPLGLIFTLYALMLRRLWLGNPLSGRVSAVNTCAKRRVTRLVFVVVLVFVASWCPFGVVKILKSVGLYEKRTDTSLIVLEVASEVLAYGNSCVNPFLYTFLLDRFRKDVCKVFSCFRRPSANISPACNVLRATSRALHDVNCKELVNEERV